MARALWKGSISFGLVTIPVSLYPAKDESENVAFHMLHKSDLSRIHNVRMDEKDHEVPFDEVVKGYEYEKGQYVVIGEADLEAADVEATRSVDIMHFVDNEEIDITYYDTPYYTEPTKAGRKAYALLRETLKRMGKAGVAKIVIRERQHLCAVVVEGPALLAYVIRWPYQLRDASEFDLPGEDLSDLGVSPQELKMAEQLVEAMATHWSPEQYHDTYREDLLKLIDHKVKSGKVSEVSEPPRRKTGESNVIDIMSLLRRSVEQQISGSAPAAKTEAPATKKGTRRTGTSRAG